MKKVLGIIAMFSLIAFIGCKKDKTGQQEIQNGMVEGQWRISYFYDSDKDETNHFVGYKFDFNSDGTVFASNGSQSFNGTWSITGSNSNDDSPNDLDFNLLFLYDNDFNDLNDDWDISSHESNKLILIDVSGGNGGTDHLIFVKL